MTARSQRHRLLLREGVSDGLRWAAAIIASLLLHAVLFWHTPLRLSADDGTAMRQAGVTRVSFRVVSRPQLRAPTPEALPQTKPRQRRAESQRRPAPVKRAERKAQMKKPEMAAQEQQAALAPPESAGDSLVLERAQRNYLGVLLAHIEEHKFYPHAARRRGVQGVIQVSFQLHRDGRISDLRVANGPDLLRKAATDAVDAALPLPPPPPQVSGPLTVSYGMEFRLH